MTPKSIWNTFNIFHKGTASGAHPMHLNGRNDAKIYMEHMQHIPQGHGIRRASNAFELKK
jgi:hypothetical protein